MRGIGTLERIVDMVVVVMVSAGAILADAPGLEARDAGGPVLVLVGIGIAVAATLGEAPVKSPS
jgi:hypothetical protein